MSTEPTGITGASTPSGATAPDTTWPPTEPAVGQEVVGEQFGTYPAGYEPTGTYAAGGIGETTTSKTDVTKAEAGQVKDTAVGAGQQVAGTAKSEAQNVVAETKAQARGLLDQAKGEAGYQAGAQQQRLAGLVGSYADELHSLASGSNPSGPLTDLAHQASQKGNDLAQWLQSHEPAEVLDEVRAFARRRPVAFLLGAAAAGVVVGRLTRGLASNAKAEHDAAQPAHSATGTTLGTGYPTSPLTPIAPNRAAGYVEGGDLALLASDRDDLLGAGPIPGDLTEGDVTRGGVVR